MTNSNYISQNENNKIEVELEKQINEKLEEKLGSLQNNIFDKYLKPTINKIGDSMKKNIEQIQLEVDNIDKQNSLTLNRDLMFTKKRFKSISLNLNKQPKKPQHLINNKNILYEIIESNKILQILYSL